MTTKPSKNNNPTGKGGFGDNPQNIGSGHWKKEDSIPYQMNRMIRMSTEELAEWARENAKTMTVAQAIAFKRVTAAIENLADAREVMDRTTGKAKETIEQTIIEKPLPLADLPFDL